MKYSCRAGSAELRAAFPRGVASVRQLTALGIPERTVYKRCLDGGPWQRILPGIVLLFTGRPTREQEVFAAVLLCGEDAAITGLEACRRHGIQRGPVRGRGDSSGNSNAAGREVHVLIPPARQVRSVGFVHVERTKRLPEPMMRDGLPLAPLPRACIDAARRTRSRGDVIELLSDPVQRGLCTVSALGAELESGSRRGTAEPRRALMDLRDGVRSAAEQAAKHLWTATGLPEPWWNATVRTSDGVLLGVVDCWLDDVAMAWEIESSKWHLSPADHDRTVERAATLTAAGIVYTASKPKRVLNDRAAVVRMLRATYTQASNRSRPDLHAERQPRE